MVQSTQKELLTTPIFAEQLLTPKPVERKDHLKTARYTLTLIDSFTIDVGIVNETETPIERMMKALRESVDPAARDFTYPLESIKSAMHIHTSYRGRNAGTNSYERQWQFTFEGRLQDILQQMRRIRQYHTTLVNRMTAQIQVVENSQAQFLGLKIRMQDTSHWNTLTRVIKPIQEKREPTEKKKPRRAAAKKLRPKEKAQEVLMEPPEPEPRRELKPPKKGFFRGLGESIGNFFGGIFGRK